MNERREARDREVLEALDALNSERSLAVVERTRRNVREKARRMQAGRAQCRKRLGVGLLVIGFLLLLATPVLWSLSDATFGGDAMTGASIAMVTIFVMLLSMAMGVLLSRGRRRRTSS
jgi:nitrate reductase gamma subunit